MFSGCVRTVPSDRPSRGQCHQAMGRYQDAVTDLSRAIDLDPGLAWAFAERGETYRRMERHEQALADFRRAIDLDPSLADGGECEAGIGAYAEDQAEPPTAWS
jgi:tetratricopeptide (TPR) repeat protein